MNQFWQRDWGGEAVGVLDYDAKCIDQDPWTRADWIVCSDSNQRLPSRHMEAKARI